MIVSAAQLFKLQKMSELVHKTVLIRGAAGTEKRQ